MHDLTPSHALGGAAPARDEIGSITIAENSGVSLASVAARMGHETTVAEQLASLLNGPPPGPGRAHLNDPIAGFWMGPDQWMLGAPEHSHPVLADTVKSALGDTASVTEQTGAWVVFDVTGAAMVDMLERLCAAPVRTMVSGDAQRTMIHQLGCFVIRRADADHLRILGPRASAGSLRHALIAAAHSVA